MDFLNGEWGASHIPETAILKNPQRSKRKTLFFTNHVFLAATAAQEAYLSFRMSVRPSVRT